jgi:glycerol-3-phosphate dehydrogenase
VSRARHRGDAPRPSPPAASAPDALGPAQRLAAWRAAAREAFDVVVIGGGVVGTGCALDAATRGLSVLVVEQRDLASGTSSRSSKLIHGGLRYLEHGEIGLVFEALRERSLLLTRLAPHLVRPLELVLPLHRPAVDRAWLGTGVALYDLLARRPSNPLPHHRHLSKRATLDLVPALSPERLAGGIVFSDAQVDDARHTLAVARTAVAHGARVLTSARVAGLVRDGERVTGVRIVDVEAPGAPPVVVRAGVVVNATGVWTDDIEAFAGATATRVRASKGVHLVVPRDRIDAGCGLVLRTAVSVLFVLPWGERWIVGTTDTDWHLDRAHPAATRTDIGYVLGELNRVLRVPLTPADVVGVYAGLRPLLTGESDHTSTLSREHAVFETAPGLVTVAGGKYTTYRVMARDAVDHAVAALRELGADGQGSDRPFPRSVTAQVPLVGAQGWARRVAAAGTIAADHGVAPSTVERLLGRYGSRADDVLELTRRSARLARPLAAGGDVLAAEVVYAATHEGALHLDDVLARRTRLSIETPDRGTAAAPEVAALLAPVLGWDSRRGERDVARYAARVEAERASQGLPDDAAADAARLQAPDSRDP